MEKVINRFNELTTENLKMLETLKNYFVNHMYVNRKDINWADVGNAAHVNEELKSIIKFLIL